MHLKILNVAINSVFMWLSTLPNCTHCTLYNLKRNVPQLVLFHNYIYMHNNPPKHEQYVYFFL